MAYRSRAVNPFGFAVTPWVKRLLIANAVAFLIVLAFRGLIPYLVFTPAKAIPLFWTIGTYMFVHLGLFHLLFNMLALFFFGPPLEERWGSREFLKFYFIAGAGGAILSLPFPYQSIAGASGAVYGIMVAFALFWPDNQIYIWGIFPVKAKWLVAVLVGLSLFYTVSGGQAGVAHLAHLGGAGAAFLYLKSPFAPASWGGVYGSARGGSGRKLLSTFSRRVRYSAAAASGPTEVTRPAAPKKRSSEDVDRILDKISQGGIASLTDDEIQRLEEASRKFRTS